MPASTPGNISDITDRNTLLADDISNLEQSLPQGCSLDELIPCSVKQPGDLRSVGPEQDEEAKQDAQERFNYLINNVTSHKISSY